MKISTTLLALAALSLVAVSAFGQGPPNCQWTDPFTTATTGPDHYNTSGGVPCVAFRLTYDAVGMTGLSIQIEGAPWNASGTGPGTYAIIPSTNIAQGTNPLTGATSGTLVVTGSYYAPFIRTNVTVFTPTGASGTITARLYGYIGTSAADLPGSGAFVNPMTALGDMIYGLPTPARVPGNITTGIECLQQLGTGSASAAPFWDTCPTAGILTYYFTPTTSSPTSTYLQMTAAPYATNNSQNFTGVASNAVLQNWATNVGVPNLTTIPPGSFDCHVRGYKNGGSTTTLYCEIWEVSATEVDIAKIGTTENSPPLTTFETGYDLHFVLGTTYATSSNASRIVARVWENSVAAPTITLTYGGESDAHLELPSPTVDVTNFVPYTGATTDLNMGTHSVLGYVKGPSSATDGDLAVFDGVTGKLIKDGGALPTGNVVGPASATDGHLAVFNGATGKLLKDGGAPSGGGGFTTCTTPATIAFSNIYQNTNATTAFYNLLLTWAATVSGGAQAFVASTTPPASAGGPGVTWNLTSTGTVNVMLAFMVPPNWYFSISAIGATTLNTSNQTVCY